MADDAYRIGPEGSWRAVPLAVRLDMAKGSLVAWLGFALAAGIMWFFVSYVDLRGMLIDFGAQSTAPAEVRGVGATQAEIGDSTVYWVSYGFTASGAPYEGCSYTIAPPLVGARAEAVFPTGDPGDSRLSGADRAPFGKSLLVLIPVLMAVGSLWGILLSARSGRRALALMRAGRLSWGRLSREPRVLDKGAEGDEPTHEVRFAFETEGGDRREVDVRTRRPERFVGSETVLLYAPQDPSEVTLIDDLPGAPLIARDGSMTLRRARFACSVAVLCLAFGVSVFAADALFRHLLAPRSTDSCEQRAKAIGQFQLGGD
jgi:hypothetical protein